MFSDTKARVHAWHCYLSSRCQLDCTFTNIQRDHFIKPKQMGDRDRGWTHNRQTLTCYIDVPIGQKNELKVELIKNHCKK